MTSNVMIVSRFSALRMIGGSEDVAPANMVADEVVEVRWKENEPRDLTEREDSLAEAALEWIKGGLASIVFEEWEKKCYFQVTQTY